VVGALVLLPLVWPAAGVVSATAVIPAAALLRWCGTSLEARGHCQVVSALLLLLLLLLLQHIWVAPHLVQLPPRGLAPLPVPLATAAAAVRPTALRPALRAAGVPILLLRRLPARPGVLLLRRLLVLGVRWVLAARWLPV
jgi:hypothetical protein